MRGYAIGVRRSLLQRDLLLGVPTMGLVLVASLALIFIYLLRWFFTAVPVALIYVLIRHFTSRDPWLIEIWLESVQQKDIFIP
jgi:type IV secretory pathway TrbD component